MTEPGRQELKLIGTLSDKELIEAIRNYGINVCSRCVIDYWRNASSQMRFVVRNEMDNAHKEEWLNANRQIAYRGSMAMIASLMKLAHLRGWEIQINDYVSGYPALIMYGDPVCDVHANECRERELGPMTVRMGQWRK